MAATVDINGNIEYKMTCGLGLPYILEQLAFVSFNNEMFLNARK